MSVEDLTDLVEDQIDDALAAVPGVADVQVYGDRDKIFRVDVNQAKLASRGLTVADSRNALATVAFDTPAGSLTTSNQDLVVRTTADGEHARSVREHRSSTAAPGCRDVATVTLGADTGSHIAALQRQDRHRHRHHPRRRNRTRSTSPTASAQRLPRSRRRCPKA